MKADKARVDRSTRPALDSYGRSDDQKSVAQAATICSAGEAGGWPRACGSMESYTEIARAVLGASGMTTTCYFAPDFTSVSLFRITRTGPRPPDGYFLALAFALTIPSASRWV